MKKGDGVLVRNPYDGSRVRVTVNCGSETRTKQAFKDECNVNKIVARYRRTGQLPVREGAAQFRDCTKVTSYFDAVLEVKAAERAFAALPSHVRKAFRNDPGELLGALEDPDRREELEELGILDKSPAEPEKPAAPESTEPVSVKPPVSEDVAKK